MILIICLGVVLACFAPGTSRTGNPNLYKSPWATHSNSFFDARYFRPETVENKSFDGRIYGAVVPHHLLAHSMIAQVFARLQQEKPSRLILLGPNHKNLGARILTSSLGWETPFGTVETDEGGINQLLGSDLVKKDDKAFSTEHSMGNLMPFIKHYLPDAKIVPIIFHHDVSKKEAALIAEQLSPLIDEDTVIIASVDFSHYLPRREAEEKDEETLKAMETKNLSTLFSMGNDHLDSPASLGTLFLAMGAQDIEDFTLLDHTNSGMLLGNDLIETTSYMTMIFIK